MLIYAIEQILYQFLSVLQIDIALFRRLGQMQFLLLFSDIHNYAVLIGQFHLFRFSHIYLVRFKER